ncbi:MAG: prepilin peptidase, partial [Parcubacteria group bacterium]|nr:prepilin peptidase [Parcubacteria group bacterium]
QYPLVEIATGALFLLIFNFQFLIFNEFSIFQFLKLIYLLAVASSLIVIFVYDLRHFIIPDKVIYPTIALTLFYTLFVWVIEHWSLIRNLTLEISNFEPLINSIGAAILASAFFFAIYAFSKGTWMGFGDVKLALLMGLVLGFPGIIVALFFAFVVGAVLSLFLVFFGKKQWESQVPFGPFLVFGTFLALFFGSPIVNWYLSMFLP